MGHTLQCRYIQQHCNNTIEMVATLQIQWGAAPVSEGGRKPRGGGERGRSRESGMGGEEQERAGIKNGYTMGTGREDGAKAVKEHGDISCICIEKLRRNRDFDSRAVCCC